MSSAPSPPFHPHWRSTPLPKRPTTIAADVAVQTAKVLNVTKVQPIIIDKSPANSLHLLEWNGHVRAWVHAMGRRRESSARSEEHTSELQSLMRISHAVFCLKKKKTQTRQDIKNYRSIHLHPLHKD